MNPTPEPLLLNFETDTTCNAACTFCMHRHLTRRRHRATWSQLLNLMYWHVPNAKEVNPFGLQEPTLEPRLAAILSNCKLFNRHARTVLYSTLTRFDEDAWRHIIRWNVLDELHVSFYGPSKRVYERLQPGLDYAAVQRHIKQLLRLRRRLRWRRPEVTMHLMITPETLPYVTRFKQRWAPVVDAVAYTHFDAWCGNNPYDAAFEASVWGPPATARPPCHRLWSALVVHSDGTVVPCCLDADNSVPLGNIHTDRDAFMGDAFQQFRARHQRGEQADIPLCAECSLWRYETPKPWNAFWQKLNPVTSAANR